MKRIDRHILGELLGPWTFGVAIFTVLIWAGSFLFEFTRLLSEGVPFPLVLQLTFLLLPGILAKTFSMAMLLGTLLAFGRLSGDSEIVALRAGGISILRIMAPVAVFGALVSLVTFAFNDYVVPQASIQASALKDRIVQSVQGRTERAATQPLYEEGRLIGNLSARDFDLATRTLTSVTIVTYDQEGRAETLFEVPRLEFDSLEKWRAIGPSTVYFLRDQVKAEFPDGLWPDQVVRPDVTPDQLNARDERNLDVWSSAEIRAQWEKLQADPTVPKEQIVNLEFGFWNKFAIPLAALVFGLVGAPLGIRSHRAGTAVGFWLSVVIIFGYMLVTNALSIMAQGGAIPAWLASFGPVIAGGLVAVELIRRKNAQ